MKKIIPVLLIILLVLNTFGFNLLLDYMILKCKYDFSNEKYHDPGQITLIKINENDEKDLQRVDDNEVRYKNKMYDIIKETKKDCILYIYCINDKQEDNLFEMLFKVNKNDYPDGKSTTVNLENLLIKNYLLNENELIHFQYKSCRIFTYIMPDYNSPLEEIILPPPELLS